MNALSLAAAPPPPPWFFAVAPEPQTTSLRIQIIAARAKAVAGRIQSAGSSLPMFKPGEAVFGWDGTSVCLASKPRTLSFDQAVDALVPAVTALQMVCDHAVVLPAHRVLVLGADTATGAYAKQLAEWRGAEVFVTPGPRVDIILDTVGRAAQLAAAPFIKTCGAVISSISLLDPEVSEERFIRSAIAHPVISRSALSRIAALFDSGVLTFKPEMPCRARI